jgi:hypothetical protein
MVASKFSKPVEKITNGADRGFIPMQQVPISLEIRGKIRILPLSHQRNIPQKLQRVLLHKGLAI